MSNGERQCPRCGEKTDSRSGPITSDGTMDGAYFKCCSCSTVYSGRQAARAAMTRAPQETP